ncbi:MAG: hypothetical protein WC539_00515 [Nitrospirota bacterium]
MAQKSGSLKRVFLVVLFLVLAIVVFILFGGGKLLKETGNWLGGMGNKAETVKQEIEKKASTVEKGVTKGIDTIKGDKK